MIPITQDKDGPVLLLYKFFSKEVSLLICVRVSLEGFSENEKEGKKGFRRDPWVIFGGFWRVNGVYSTRECQPHSPNYQDK